MIQSLFRFKQSTSITSVLSRSVHIGYKRMANIVSSYDQPVSIAVIGGTGLQQLPGFTHIATLDVTTPWGSPSAPISILHHTSPINPSKTTPIAFLSRHGLFHEYAPHEVPSRNNIAALRTLGVRCIIAFSAVGSLQEEVKPRDFVVPDQIIDRTKGVRPFTFFEMGMVGHVGFADPFDMALGGVIRSVGGVLEEQGRKCHNSGTVICMEGPQFSTRAESHLYRSWGGTVINMSALPEAKLAREAEIAYQMICMSTDYDCWYPSAGDVTVEMVMGNMKANAETARTFLGAVLDELSKDEHADLVKAKHLEGQSKFATGITAPRGRSREAMAKMEWLFPEHFE